MLNVPNVLTLTRIAVAPFVMGLVAFGGSEWRWAAAWTFLISATTDFLDGMLARRWNQVTLLGKFLDPLADKILVLGAALVLLRLGEIPSGLVFVIVGREIAVSTLRTVAMGEGVVVAARDLGKLKTVFQMAGLFGMLWAARFSVGGMTVSTSGIGLVLLWVGAGLALLSAVDYVVAFARARPEGAEDA